MAGFSNVVIMGRATRAVELKTTSGGTSVAEMSVAVNRKYKDQEEVSFFDVTLWGRTAEIAAEYVEKGKEVLVAGRLKQDSWEDPEGNRRSKVVVIAETLQLIGGKVEGENVSAGGDEGPKEEKKPAGRGRPKKDNKEKAPPAEDDSIPF